MTKCTFRFWASFRSTRNGIEQRLPASRKARALLGFLAASARPCRRERLCELFWDLPDDPRASLRWALSKLRQVVDTDDTKMIAADRERARLRTELLEVDFVTIRKRLFDEPDFIPPPELRNMAETLSHPFLAGLDNAGRDEFRAWLAAERADCALMAGNVLRRLTLHPGSRCAGGDEVVHAVARHRSAQQRGRSGNGDLPAQDRAAPRKPGSF